MLEALHERHPGVVRMKAIARSYMWWNGLDKDIEKQAKACLPCQEQKPNPPAAPHHTWQWPTTLWKRIHVDFTSPFLGKMFLIVVDAHSKWSEVVMMPTTTSTETTTHCKQSLRDMVYLNTQTMDLNSPLKSLSNLYNKVGSNTSEVHHTTHPPMDWLNALYKPSRTQWRQVRTINKVWTLELHHFSLITVQLLMQLLVFLQINTSEKSSHQIAHQIRYAQAWCTCQTVSTK